MVPYHRTYDEEEIAAVLRTPLLSPAGRQQRYRFPNVKSRQIATAQREIAQLDGGLKALIAGDSAEETRRRLVACVPGLGLKQASLFLRSVDASVDFAILDVHVLRYMNCIGLVRTPPKSLSTELYLVFESILVHYAQRLGCSVGHVDRAIWAVMSSSRTAAL